MSNLVKHAENELRLAGLFDDDADYGGKIAKGVLDLIKLLASQGHSGGSAAQAIELFGKLARYEPLTPLTGSDDEWHDPIGNGELLQNVRCSHVFQSRTIGSFDTHRGDRNITFPYTP